MLEIASEIVICLLIAALIGFIIGYLVAKSSSNKTSPIATEEEVAEKDETLVVEKNETEKIQIPAENVVSDAAKAPEEVIEPELLTSARKGKKDNLTEIKGIGPKLEKQLNKMGVYHFDQIANWTETDIRWLEANTTFAHRAIKDLWVKQAKSL